jgi:hypothetical protein
LLNSGPFELLLIISTLRNDSYIASKFQHLQINGGWCMFYHPPLVSSFIESRSGRHLPLQPLLALAKEKQCISKFTFIPAGAAVFHRTSGSPCLNTYLNDVINVIPFLQNQHTFLAKNWFSKIPENLRFQHPDAFRISWTSLSLRRPSLGEDKFLSTVTRIWTISFPM